MLYFLKKGIVFWFYCHFNGKNYFSLMVFEKYSYRQKKVMLLIVIVLLGAAAYKRSFSVTLQQLTLNEELKERVSEAQNSVETLKANDSIK